HRVAGPSRHTGMVHDQAGLFDADSGGPGERRDGVVRPDLADADLTYLPAFFGPVERQRLLEELIETTAWRQDAITMYGRAVPIPRLQAWYGDPGRNYAYSGIEL